MLAWTKTIASKLFTPLERISHPWHTFQWHEGWIPFLQKMPKKGTQYIRCSIEWFVHHLFPLVSLLQQLVDRQNIGKSEPYLLCQASRRQAADGPCVRMVPIFNIDASQVPPTNVESYNSENICFSWWHKNYCYLLCQSTVIREDTKGHLRLI